MHVAPIVFARTFHVDYRFLVIPDGFKEDDIRVLKPMVGEAITSPHMLESSVRWLTCRVGRRLILACSGFVRILGGADSPYARDVFNRDIVAFVGVVFPEECPAQFPTEPPRSQLFELLREAFERQWLTPVELPAVETAFSEITVATEPLRPAADFPHADGVSVWPDNGAANWLLIQTTAASGNRSAIIGAPRPPADDAAALFTDVVVAGDAKRYIVHSAGPLRKRDDSIDASGARASAARRRTMPEAREPVRAPAVSKDVWIVVGGAVVGGVVGAAAKAYVLGAAALGGVLAGLGVVIYRSVQNSRHPEGLPRRRSATPTSSQRTPPPRQPAAADRVSSAPASPATTSWTVSDRETTRSKTWK